MGTKKTATALTISHLTAPDCILALDMSLEHTGYAQVWLPTGEITKGLIEPKGLKGMPRLAFLRDQVLTRARESTSMMVLIEGYSYGSKGASVINLGELGGVIRLALHEAEVPYLEIEPSSLKKFVTGKGNAPKQIMLKEVFKRWAEDLDDDNVADAFGLMQLGLALVGRNRKPLVSFQTEVVANVIKTYMKDFPRTEAA